MKEIYRQRWQMYVDVMLAISSLGNKQSSCTLSSRSNLANDSLLRKLVEMTKLGLIKNVNEYNKYLFIVTPLGYKVMGKIKEVSDLLDNELEVLEEVKRYKLRGGKNYD